MSSIAEPFLRHTAHPSLLLSVPKWGVRLLCPTTAIRCMRPLKLKGVSQQFDFAESTALPGPSSAGKGKFEMQQLSLENSLQVSVGKPKQCKQHNLSCWEVGRQVKSCGGDVAGSLPAFTGSCTQAQAALGNTKSRNLRKPCSSLTSPSASSTAAKTWATILFGPDRERQCRIGQEGGLVRKGQTVDPNEVLIKETLWLESTTGHTIKERMWMKGSFFSYRKQHTCRLLVLLADFNYPNIHWKSSTASCKQSRTLLERVEDSFLVQVVESLTRGNMLLDLFLTNTEDFIVEIKTGRRLGCSDHALVQFSILKGTGLIKGRIKILHLRKANFWVFRALVYEDAWETALRDKGANEL